MSLKSLVIIELTITKLSVKKSEYEYGLDHVGGIRCKARGPNSGSTFTGLLCYLPSDLSLIGKQKFKSVPN